MGKWKKFMAVALAVSMAVPSCIPQTLLAAEFSAEESMSIMPENFEDGNSNEDADADTDASTDENLNVDSLDENLTDRADSGDEELSTEPEFGTGETEITDGEDKKDVTEGEPEASDSFELAEAGQATEGYVIQLYSSKELKKTYVIPFAEADKAKAPAALTRSGYIFKEWNTKANGKGTSYKPGDSIKKLLEESGAAIQNENAETAQISEMSKEHSDEIPAENRNENENTAESEVLSETQDETDSLAAAAADTETNAESITEADTEINTEINPETDSETYSETYSQTGMESDAEPDVESDMAQDAVSEEVPAAEASTENENPTVNLYAIWEKATSYKITYKLNGGKNNSKNPKTYTTLDKVTLKTPTRTGYHFSGWYLDSKFKKKISVIEKGSKGAKTLYAKWIQQVNPSSSAASLTSVRGAKAKTIAATVTVPKYVKSYDEYYYLVYVNSNTGKVRKEATKVKKPEASNQKITFKLDISKHPEYAQGRFAVAVKKSKSAWSVISGKSYVSSPEKLASNQAAYFIPKTKKGIQSTDMKEVTETKSKTAFFNLYASDVMNSYGTETYTYNGKTYHFDGMYGWRHFVQQCNSKGIQVTAQIGLDKNANTQDMTIGNSPYAETAYYGWNTDNTASRQKMEAMFAYLSEIFGSNDCYVSNWILGNEVNSASRYYYVGNVSLDKYMSMYSEAFRCLYNAVRSSRASSKVFICLDNCWNQKNIFSVCYTSRSTLDTFASKVTKLQKGLDWNLAYHAYSQPLTESQFWSSINAPLLTNDGNTATFITMHNIQALTDYVRNRYGSNTRVILSEQGFSSSFGGQANQAASMALAYYKAACNPMIDAFIIRSYEDEAHEVAQGLALGLRDTSGKKKTIYNVFRYMDSSSSLKYTGKVLNRQVGNWQSMVPGYTAKRVYNMYRN